MPWVLLQEYEDIYLYEPEETYEYLNSKLPNIGDFVTTPDGLKGEVQSVSVLRQLVKVVVNLENDEKEIREYKAQDLRFKPRRKKDKAFVSDDELKEFLKEGSYFNIFTYNFFNFIKFVN